MRPSRRIVESDWLAPRLRRFGSAVAAVVPDGFPAYVRILHPALAGNDVPVRWADVAAWSGRTMHRLVQFHRIVQPSALPGLGAGRWTGNDPEPGNLRAGLLAVLCAALAGHTGTPESCWFCLWEGYGWLHGSPAVGAVRSTEPDVAPPATGHEPLAPALSPDVLCGPRVRLQKRNYVLFEGPLSAASKLGWTAWGDTFFPQSPNLFWPQDHAWCVASEIDLFCTLVGGSESLAQALLTEPLLEAWRVEPQDPVSADSDRINT